MVQTDRVGPVPAETTILMDGLSPSTLRCSRQLLPPFLSAGAAVPSPSPHSWPCTENPLVLGAHPFSLLFAYLCLECPCLSSSFSWRLLVTLRAVAHVSSFVELPGSQGPAGGPTLCVCPHWRLSVLITTPATLCFSSSIYVAISS